MWTELSSGKASEQFQAEAPKREMLRRVLNHHAPDLRTKQIAVHFARHLFDQRCVKTVVAARSEAFEAPEGNSSRVFEQESRDTDGAGPLALACWSQSFDRLTNVLVQSTITLLTSLLVAGRKCGPSGHLGINYGIDIRSGRIELAILAEEVLELQGEIAVALNGNNWTSPPAD